MQTLNFGVFCQWHLLNIILKNLKKIMWSYMITRHLKTPEDLGFSEKSKCTLDFSPTLCPIDRRGPGCF